MKKRILKKSLVISIMLLFIGMGIVPAGNTVENEHSYHYHRSLKSVDNSEEILYVETIWYSYVHMGSMGTGFYAYGPGINTRFREWEGNISGGTWTNDGRWLCCIYGNGTLYDVDPKTFDVSVIGDGGTGLNGLAYDPVNEKLYGASSNGFTGGLWLIDLETGEQEYVGDFVSTTWMIGIAFDADGVLYGWDINPDYLYTIDLDTGEATEVGPLGINLNYAQDGAFDLYTDTLYLTAYTTSGGLYECDEDTGQCTLIGNLQGEGTAHAISYELNMTPPVTNILFDPLYPDGDNDWYVSNVTVTLNASDNTGVIATYYRINGGEWQIYESSFIISKEGSNIIEYYSVDYVGNIEEVKSAEIKMDQTPPTVELKRESIVNETGVKVIFSAYCDDVTSGLKGVEFYMNDELQIYDEDEPYEWIFEFDIDYRVFGLIQNRQFTEENVSFYAIYVWCDRIAPSHPFLDSYYVKAVAYDNAGNLGYDDYSADIGPPSRPTYGQFTFPNDYTGYIGFEKEPYDI